MVSDREAMKPPAILSILVVTFLALGQVGCKKQTQADATQPLKESFQVAEPEVKQAIEVVTTNLKARNYAEATRAMEPVVSGRPLTDPQKQAIGVALQQINQAIAADPSLDTKEMYDLRAKMFQAVHRGPRF
jgi:hypothetical protein